MNAATASVPGTATPTQAAATDDLRVCGISKRGWPIERLVILLAGAVTLFTLLMGRHHDPRWRLMTGFIATNLVAQAIVGWCPASLVMRRLGFRRAIDRQGL